MVPNSMLQWSTSMACAVIQYQFGPLKEFVIHQSNCCIEMALCSKWHPSEHNWRPIPFWQCNSHPNCLIGIQVFPQTSLLEQHRSTTSLKRCSSHFFCLLRNFLFEGFFHLQYCSSGRELGSRTVNNTPRLWTARSWQHFYKVTGNKWFQVFCEAEPI